MSAHSETQTRLDESQRKHAEFQELWREVTTNSPLFQALNRTEKATAEHYAWQVFTRTTEKEPAD